MFSNVIVFLFPQPKNDRRSNYGNQVFLKATLQQLSMFVKQLDCEVCFCRLQFFHNRRSKLVRPML